MKRFMLVCLVSALVPAVVTGGPAHAYDNTSLSGAITCSSTVVANSNALASGQITLVADGSGDWTGGSASYQLSGGGACNYVLAAGKYTVNEDGSGESVTRWSLGPGSSPQSCAQTVPRSLSAISLVTNSFSSSQGPNRSESGTCAFAQ
jgi:hypothetical protein